MEVAARSYNPTPDDEQRTRPQAVGVSPASSPYREDSVLFAIDEADAKNQTRRGKDTQAKEFQAAHWTGDPRAVGRDIKPTGNSESRIRSKSLAGQDIMPAPSSCGK